MRSAGVEQRRAARAKASRRRGGEGGRMARGSGISQDELRKVNLSAVLARVHASGPTSRAALTAELGLNRSTIGDLTAHLEALGLVSEMRPTQSRGAGRPSHLVVPRQDVTVVAIALDVDR